MKLDENICEICRKTVKSGCGCVWYSGYESYLCHSHYRKWIKVHDEFERKHGSIIGNAKLCRQLEIIYLKWLKKESVKP